MAMAYQRAALRTTASFELTVRTLPAERNFLVVAGVDELLDLLEDWHFDADDVSFLESLGRFDSEFLDLLRATRFECDVRAVLDGDVVFAGEPIVEVRGPLLQAQIVETLVINVVATRTMQASKAVRVALAAGDSAFVDFSARRDHGIDAAMGAAR